MINCFGTKGLQLLRVCGLGRVRAERHSHARVCVCAAMGEPKAEVKVLNEEGGKGKSECLGASLRCLPRN